MRISARDKLIHDASTDLQGRVLEWLRSHELTTAEELAVLNHTIGGIIHSTLKSCIRRERDSESPQERSSLRNDAPENGRNGRGGRHRNG